MLLYHWSWPHTHSSERAAASRLACHSSNATLHSSSSRPKFCAKSSGRCDRLPFYMALLYMAKVLRQKLRAMRPPSIFHGSPIHGQSSAPKAQGDATAFHFPWLSYTWSSSLLLPYSHGACKHLIPSHLMLPSFVPASAFLVGSRHPAYFKDACMHPSTSPLRCCSLLISWGKACAAHHKSRSSPHTMQIAPDDRFVRCLRWNASRQSTASSCCSRSTHMCHTCIFYQHLQMLREKCTAG